MISKTRNDRLAMNVPRNVLWFEVLLYLSLTLDALSVAFQDRTPSARDDGTDDHGRDRDGGRPDPVAGLFVWLAARRRKNWPRWVLAAALVLSVISLVQIIGESGWSSTAASRSFPAR